jgi:hypothetical protein
MYIVFFVTAFINIVSVISDPWEKKEVKSPTSFPNIRKSNGIAIPDPNAVTIHIAINARSRVSPRARTRYDQFSCIL